MWITSGETPSFFLAELKAAISFNGIDFKRHALGLLVKICMVLQFFRRASSRAWRREFLIEQWTPNSMMMMIAMATY